MEPEFDCSGKSTTLLNIEDIENNVSFDEDFLLDSMPPKAQQEEHFDFKTKPKDGEQANEDKEDIFACDDLSDLSGIDLGDHDDD